MSTQSGWKIKGEYFESCNCEVLCPCLLSHATALPTEGHCDVVLAFHVAQGNFGATDISGLNAVLALQTPGAMAKGNGTLAVYVDARAGEAQRAALEAIFTGAAGGPPSLFAGMVSKRLPVKAVPINFESEGNRRRLVISQIADVNVEGIAGAGEGSVVWLENIAHPASRKLAAARGVQSRFQDGPFTFDNSGRNGHFSPIDWSQG